MPAAIGTQLNRSVSATVTPGEIAVGINFCGINLDATSGSGYLIESIEVSLGFFVLADYNNVESIALQINRNLALSPTIDIGAQIAGAEAMVISQNQVRPAKSHIRSFIPAIELPKDARYSIHGGVGFTAAPAGNIVLIFQAVGRAIIPPGAFPLTTR